MNASLATSAINSRYWEVAEISGSHGGEYNKTFLGRWLCSLPESNGRFIGASCPHNDHSDVGGSKHLWNVGQFLQYYTANI
jgi:hypothetical protein